MIATLTIIDLFSRVVNKERLSAKAARIRMFRFRVRVRGSMINTES
jgi:hypothetical protein